jgi:membrane-bound lytic murein transglycosylase D
MKMKAPELILTLTALAGLLCSGCEESAKRPVRATAPQLQFEPPPTLGRIPLQTVRAHSASLAPHPRAAADILIEKVEEAFRSGEQNYKAGHLEKARRDFDHAVDWMLMSGLDLHSDLRLERVFDRIVSAIHAYEAAAFKEGDGFYEARAEPAAIDEIADLAFPVDPRLREMAEGVLKNVPHDLPLVVNDHVLSYLNFFQTPRGRAIVERGLERGGRYRDMIARILGEEGLPQDLIYLAQAESAFQPHAVSRARAVGMWQFMSYTGRDYGLRTTWWVDDRRNPEKATRAAARHLRDLYAEFNDWLLAMAAYNVGAGGVTRAIQRTGYADFWELYRRNVLPRETRNYVPIIIALALIAKDADRYGIAVQPEPPLRTDRVKPGAPIDLRLVAETIDTSVETLKALNPHLLRMVTPADADFELHLPEGSAERFFAEIAVIPEDKRVLWRRHRVDTGESLSSIAKKYRVTPGAIAEANNLDAKAELQVGDKLIIPATLPASEQGRLTRYRVRRGDTLFSIAEQFSVTVDELRRWNGIRGREVPRGTTLKVYPGGRPPAADRASANRSGAKAAPAKASRQETQALGPAVARMHKVRPGETLWSIARAYQTTVEALRAANQFLFHRQLQVGDQLTILTGR